LVSPERRNELLVSLRMYCYLHKVWLFVDSIRLSNESIRDDDDVDDVDENDVDNEDHEGDDDVVGRISK